MSTVSIEPPKPVTPWSRRREYVAVGLRREDNAPHGNAKHDRRKLRRALDRELQQLTKEYVR